MGKENSVSESKLPKEHGTDLSNKGDLVKAVSRRHLEVSNKIREVQEVPSDNRVQIKVKFNKLINNHPV
jgi:hypothetical protein